MEGKVTLYDANGIEIGETYSRRARQLVKQQRAVWADDTHTAIKFMPDAEEDWEPFVAEAAPPPPAPAPPPAPVEGEYNALYAMAWKRMRDRKWVIIHTLLLIPGFIFLTILVYGFSHRGRITEFGYFMMGGMWGVWGMLYIYRVRDYFREHGKTFHPSSWSARQRFKLQAEVEQLKRMGYTE